MSSEAVRSGDRPIENWPDKEFLETALQKWLKDSKVEVTEFTSRIATSKGDNYTSDIYRVIIRCANKKDPLTILIKRLLLTGPTADLMMESSAFVREEQMLQTILPEMHAVLKKVMPDVEPFGASYVYSTPGVLAMEDLQQGGFRMAQRRIGLDLNHCSLVLRTLARFHAASVLVMERKSVDVSVFRDNIIVEPNGRAQMEVYCTSMLTTLSDELKTFDGLEEYSAKLSKFADEQSFLSRLQQLVENHEGSDFLVLSHGDLWTNNILFRYSSSGEPDGVRFVDLQMASIASPCIDLQYFLTASSNETVRTTSFDQLLKEYHETLCKSMAVLNCSTRPPTLEYLKKDFDKWTPFGMFSAFNVMPGVIGDEMFDFDEMFEQGKPQNELFRGKSYRKALEWFLPLFESKGFL